MGGGPDLPIRRRLPQPARGRAWRWAVVPATAVSPPRATHPRRFRPQALAIAGIADGSPETADQNCVRSPFPGLGTARHRGRTMGAHFRSGRALAEG